MNKTRLMLLSGVAAGLMSVSTVSATFHFMQIEQVIGSVDGDQTAQAIQLRMRTAGQNIVGQSRLVAFDAAGANPIIVMDIPANVANSGAGVRVLVSSASFNALTTPACTPDFVITNPIPPAYFNGGKLVFENDNSSIIVWNLAWGGAAYTGTNTGSTFNDADGNFNPPFASPLPATGYAAIQFNGAATAASTNNAANYVLTGDTTTWVNNGGASFTLTPPPPPVCPGDITGGGGVPDGQVNVDDLNAILSAWQQNVGIGDPRDLAGNDGVVNVDDLNVVLSNWQSTCP